MAQQPFIFELNVNFSTTIQLPFIDVFPFDCVVDWGDGSQNAITAYNDPASNHAYSPGNYTVTITGYCGGWSVNNGAIKNYLTDVIQFGTQTYFNNGNAFYGCSLLTNITATDYPGFGGYENRQNGGFFRGCPNLVYDLSGCYMGAQSVFTNMLSGDVNPSADWDFSFASWLSFSGLKFNIDITPWKDHFLSAVPSGNWVVIASLFNGNNLFNCGDDAGVSGTNFRWFNLTNAVDKRLTSFFRNCTAFNQDINTNVQNAGQPDEYIAWDISGITSIQQMFQGASSFNQDIGDWDVSSVANMSYTFNDATAFNNGGVGGLSQGMDKWDVSSVLTFAYAFWDADSFNQYIGSWVLRPAGVSCEAMFFANNSFNQDLGNWTNTGSITTIAYMFTSATAFNNGGVGGVGQGLDKWDVSNKTTFIQLFNGTPFNQYIGSWNVSSVTNMAQCFSGASSYNQDLDGWERTTPDVSTLANVTSMVQMFQNASAFNGNVSNWDVSSCTNFASMFINCTAFDQNLGAWTLASATTCNDMFYQAGMSDANLEATLYGWSLNPSTATGVSATNIALNRTYAAGSNMDLALNDPINGLVAAKGWTVTGITIV